MNADLKIACKAIPYRLMQVIPDLIDSDQAAYVKGRYIGESVWVIKDILEHANQENLDGILLHQTLKMPMILLSIILFFSVLKKMVLGLILYSGLKLCSVMQRAVL